jgi:serine phosphatase RsbU (regulator of sigma subunit)
MKKYSFILLLFTFFSLLTQDLIWGQVFIAGKVIREDGTPLKDVSVIVDDARAVITSTTGVFGVDIKGQKPTSVKATKKNFVFKDWSFDENAKKIKIVMHPLSNFRGILQDADKNPIADAKIIMSEINPDKPALTNKKGEFDLVLPEGADINKPGSITINNKEIDASNFSVDGNGKLQINVPTSVAAATAVVNNNVILEKANVLEQKKINKIKVNDQTGSPVEKLKIKVDDDFYFTDTKGEVFTQKDIHQDTKLSIEGFKIKVLPSDFYLLVNIEPLSNDEVADTTAQEIGEIIKETATVEVGGNYEDRLDEIIKDLEVQKQLLLQLNEQTRIEIEEITKRIIEDKTLTPEQKKELADKRTELEVILVKNEIEYQNAVDRTKIALDSMRQVLKLSEDENREKTKTLQQEKEEALRNKIVFIAIAISLVVIVIIFFVANRRVNKEHDQLEKAHEKLEKANTDLEESFKQVSLAKYEIEQKNNQITTSIRYAETMQKAILPLDETFNKNFTDHFKIYIPKDIVSGDFYWCLPLEKETFLALVDCTGHGVPGAFMSLIGNNSLNEIVNQKNVREPALILEELNASIRKALRQEFTDNDDGMDVALCRIDKPEKDGKVKVVFAGAKRNMLYCAQKMGKELFEIKGDKKTVGGFFKGSKSTQFSNQEIELEKGDLIYMFTDGLSDQPNNIGEKFSSVKLKELLRTNAHLTLSEQQTIIMEELKLHQSGASQRDDITLIGVRI